MTIPDGSANDVRSEVGGATGLIGARGFLNNDLVLIFAATGFALVLQPLFDGPLLTVAALICASLARWAVSTALRTETPLTDEQTQIASTLSHDLRTQLSIIQLQINKIPDPRARVAEHDIRDLTTTIDRLFVLAKGQR